PGTVTGRSHGRIPSSWEAKRLTTPASETRASVFPDPRRSGFPSGSRSEETSDMNHCTNRPGEPSRPRSARRATGAMTGVAFGAMLLAGCDVTNPGPVQDEYLSDPGAQPGLVNGAVRRMSELIGWTSYTTARLSREIFPGGQTGAGGHDVSTQGGHVQPGSYGGYFSDAQQARFIAETAITRFTEVGAGDDLLYDAHLWAGFAYRTLGE